MWNNLPLKGAVYLSFVLGVTSIMVVIIMNNYLPPVVPLLYGLPFGSDQLVPKFGLLIAPVTGLLIVLVNIALTRFTKDDFFEKTLIITGVFVSILAATATIKTILLVAFF